jgi:hypothetical protein
MLDRCRDAGVAVLLLLTIGGCTVPAGRAPAAPRELPAALAPTELPDGVPLAPGSVTIVTAGLVGEFSRFPRARWMARVLAPPVAGSVDALAIAEGELAAAGYRPLGSGPGASPLPELWMERAGTTVVVRAPTGMPRLLEYTVTRSYSECARSYCD